MDAAWEAVATAAGPFWRAFWALALGYAISASIQVSYRFSRVVVSDLAELIHD